MIHKLIKYATFKALTINRYPHGACASRGENCVNFGLPPRSDHSVMCVNFAANQPLRQARL